MSDVKTLHTLNMFPCSLLCIESLKEAMKVL